MFIKGNINRYQIKILNISLPCGGQSNLIKTAPKFSEKFSMDGQDLKSHLKHLHTGKSQTYQNNNDLKHVLLARI